MKSKKADSTKTRQPSTGKKQVPGKARTVTDTDDWLSIDDLEPVVWTAEELAAPHVLRTPDGLTVATYPPNVEQLRKRPSRLEEDGFSYGFVAIPPAQKLSNGKCSSCGRLVCRGLLGCRGASPAEFVVSYEASCDRQRKAVWESPGWINPDLPSAERRRELEAQRAKLTREAADEEEEQPMGNGKDHDSDDDDDDANSWRDDDDDKNMSPGARVKKAVHKKDPLHIKLARSFITLMDIDNRLQRFNDVEGRSLQMWKYQNGLWSWLPDRSVTKWLAPQLQQSINYFSKEKHSTVKVINEAAQHIIRHEKVCIDSDAIFDQHGKVPTLDGLIDPITLKIEPLKPGHFATWVLPKVKYDKNATCPYWEQMLNDALSDKPKAERDLDIQLIQDVMGMSLLDAKPKALQRGLILLGPGDSGKSSLQQVMAGMLADKNKWITTPLGNLSNTHGTQAFIRRAPWVLGEAFTTSVWHIADTVKMILGGDNIEINPKNKDAISIKPNAPPFWATNYPPKFKEPTRAIVERIVVMELTKVFDKAKPVGVAAAAKKINPSWWPHDLILNTERSGLLNWMLVGAKRALKRGDYINTKAGEALLEGILDDSNVVRAFVKDCVDFDPSTMISAPDFMAALVQWWHEHHGDEVRPPNATMIGIHLKALADPRILQDKETFKNKAGLRFYLGIKLNQAGLDHWETASLDDKQSGRSAKSSARTSSSITSVTRQIGSIEPDWLKLPEVEMMQKAHEANRKKTKL